MSLLRILIALVPCAHAFASRALTAAVDGVCRNGDCGCGPPWASPWCNDRNSVIQGWCSESEAHCDLCANTDWCSSAASPPPPPSSPPPPPAPAAVCPGTSWDGRQCTVIWPATGDNVLGTFSLFGNRSRPLGYSSLAEPNTWVVSADEVTTYSVSGASSSGALLQCNTPFCEVRMSIGSLTEPPILRLGPNVEAAVTSISANNAVIIVKLDNPDTQFNCGGSASTRQCIVQRPPAYPPPP